MSTGPLSADLLDRMDAHWRAGNYLSVGQHYLYDNPLLRKPLDRAHIKPLVVGHWGTSPGQNFIYVHLNRVIKERDLDMFYVAGPGHGGPALVVNTYLEGTYTEVNPDVSLDEAGLKRLFTPFSFPGGISSHVAPTKAVSWATRSATPSAPPSTIPDSSSPASSATGKPRPAPWQSPGIPTSSSTRSPTGSFCRSCT